MRNINKKFARKGVALVIVMLVIVAATSVAMISIRLMQSNTRGGMSFKMNRQATMAAQQVRDFLIERVQEPDNNDMLTVLAKSRHDFMQNAYAKDGSFDTAADAQTEEMWFYPSQIVGYTQLGDLSHEELSTGYSGDLRRHIIQAGTISNVAMSPTQVAGFSEAQSFCSQFIQAKSYALIGEPVVPRGDNFKYYLLADLAGRPSAYKREMGFYKLEPVPCD